MKDAPEDQNPMAMAYGFAAVGGLGALLAFSGWVILGGEGRLEIATSCAGMAVLFLVMGGLGWLR
jgi:hypothetical protein